MKREKKKIKKNYTSTVSKPKISKTPTDGYSVSVSALFLTFIASFTSETIQEKSLPYNVLAIVSLVASAFICENKQIKFYL